MTARRAALIGTGHSVPATVLTSAEAERRLGVPVGYIEQRTGVRERHIAAPGEAVSDFAVEAARRALEAAGVASESVALLVMATSTPDYPLPPTAPIVADRLGLRVGGFDLAAACSGFLYGLVMAGGYLQSFGGDGDTALVIAGNILSHRVDWDDKATASLFGDGAGAAVLRLSSDGRGLSHHWLGTDGSAWDRIHIPAGGSREPLTPASFTDGRAKMRMEKGPVLFRDAVQRMTHAAREVLARAGIGIEAVDHFIAHQANRRLVEAVAEQLGVPPEETIVNIERFGNTSAASIPIALDEAVRDGRIRPGQRVLMVAVGSGMTAAAALLDY